MLIVIARIFGLSIRISVSSVSGSSVLRVVLLLATRHFLMGESSSPTRAVLNVEPAELFALSFVI